MRLFAIDNDDNITAIPAADQIPEGQEQFASEKELARLAANWPSDRLVNIWNSFAGVAGFGADLKPVRKFTNRKTAVARIWKAIQRLDGGEATQEADEAPVTPETAAAAPEAGKGARKGAKLAPKKARATKAARAKDGAPTAREGSKKAIVLELLRRKDGATMGEIAAATQWQSHSIRGFISGGLVKKMGLKVESFKDESGDRRYQIS